MVSAGQLAAVVENHLSLHGKLSRREDVQREVIAALSELAASVERFERHVETMIEPKVMEGARRAAAEVERLRRRLAMVERMADRGVGPDTTPEQVLETIGHFVRAALAGGQADKEPTT
jgi:hypothetical protein